MTTLRRAERQIALLEGFDVAFVAHDGRDLRGDLTGIPAFAGRFEHRAPRGMNVFRWKQRRFAPIYPGFRVEVLLAGRERARGNMHLGSVRDTYRR